MAKILKNFCSATLASNMLIGDTQITVSPGHNLPVTAGDFVLVIWNMAVYPNPADDSSTEIVIAEYSGTPNVYTVTRAQESTVAIAHSLGDTAALHLTAGTMIHNNLGNLDYATSGHTGFEPTVTKGNLTAGSTKISIGGTGTGALIGAGATVDVVPGNITHNSLSTIGANDHHNQAHVLNSSDHTVSGLTPGHVLQATGANTFGFAAVPGLHDSVTLATSADVLLGLTGQALSLDTQTAAYVLVGPVSGIAAAPTFRALVSTDIPALTYEVPLTFSTGLNRNTNTITCTITQYTDALARAAISTSVTGLTYTAASGVLSLTSGYVIPTTTEETNWNAAYGWATATSEPTGFVDRVATISWSDATLTFTITGNHDIYINGVKTTKTTASKVIADTTGLHWIYYNAAGVLSEATANPGFNFVLVATVYWNTTTDKGLLADERHGIVMDWATHELLHDTVGTRWVSGLAGSFTNTTFSIATGEIYDEDLSFVFAAPMTTCNVLYKNGAADFEWDAAATLYYKLNTTTLRYNSTNSLADVTNNFHVAYWIFATGDVTRPIVSLMGQREDRLLADARTNNKYETLLLGNLPYAEMKLLCRVILKNASGTATFIEAQDLRSVSNISTGTYIATVHNALTGLEWSLAGHNDINFNVNHNADGRTGIGKFDPATLLDVAGVITATGLEIGHATDTTLSRASAGDLNVEGNLLYRAGGTDVPVTDGGTGKSVFAVGDIVHATATTTLAGLADVAAGSYLRSGGVAVVPLWSTLILPNAATAYRLPVATSANTIGELAASGATGEYLKGNTGAIPSWATLNQAAVAGLTTADSPQFAHLGIGVAADTKGITIAAIGDVFPVFQLSTSSSAGRNAWRAITQGDQYVDLRIHGTDWVETLLGLSMAGAACLIANPAANGLAIGTLSNLPMILGTYNTERARITNAGLFLINKTSGTEQFEVNGKIRSDTAFNLNGTDGVSQAAAAGKVSDVTALAGGIATAQTQVTHIADGAHSLVGITSMTTSFGRVTALA